MTTAAIAVISDGRIRRLSSGTESLRPEALDPLAQRIRRASRVQWTGSRLSRCNDCIATLVVLTVRERDGVVRTYSCFWDSATLARIPDAVREIHQVALNISKQ